MSTHKQHANADEWDEMMLVATRASNNLPVEEIMHLIDQGFNAMKYDPAKRIAAPDETPPRAAEDSMARLQRYLRMVGKEEFDRLGIAVAFFRLVHPVCSNCGKREDEGRDCDLALCRKCDLTFYCDRKCQASHWSVHRLWCRKRYQGPRDTGWAATCLADNPNHITFERQVRTSQV